MLVVAEELPRQLGIDMAEEILSTNVKTHEKKKDKKEHGKTELRMLTEGGFIPAEPAERSISKSLDVEWVSAQIDGCKLMYHNIMSVS